MGTDTTGSGQTGLVLWLSFILFNTCVSKLQMVLFNPLHHNISMHILHTGLYTFPNVLAKRIR